MTETVRAFVALVPPEPALQVLLQAEEALLATQSLDARALLKPQGRDALHMTLVFLGETPRADLDALADGIASSLVPHLPFQLALGSWSSFGAPPRTLWAGIQGEVEPLLLLQRAVAAEAIRRGWSAEHEEFTPHVTCFRVRQPVPGLARTWKGLPLPRAAWPVREAVLFQSSPGPKGPTYLPLRSFRLGP